MICDGPDDGWWRATACTHYQRPEHLYIHRLTHRPDRDDEVHWKVQVKYLIVMYSLASRLKRHYRLAAKIELIVAENSSIKACSSLSCDPVWFVDW